MEIERLENEELRLKVAGLKEELENQKLFTERISNMLEETYVFIILGGALTSLMIIGEENSP